MNGQTKLYELLQEKGILSGEEVQQKEDAIRRQLTPRNFLTKDELERVNAALNNIKLETPKGWAHALFLFGIKQAARDFNADSAYGSCQLENILCAILNAGLKDGEIEKKFSNAARRAERYGYK